MLCIGRFSLERKRVEWELRMSFVENIVLSVVPVRETRLVTGCLHDRLLWPDDLLVFWQVFLSLLAFVVYFVSSG